MSQHLEYFAKKLRIATAIGLSGLLVACSSNTSRQSNSVTVPAAVVATVNGLPISSKLYEMYLKNGREGLGLDSNTEEGRRKLDQLREGIVSELIDRTLIAQEAERRGLSIPPEKMAEAERRAIADLGGDQKYDSYLAEHRLTRDEYRDVVRVQVYGEMMRNELNKGLAVPDDEIKSYYEAHRNDQNFQLPERVTAAHILIAARPNLISQKLQQDRNLTGDALASAVLEEMEKRRQRAEELRRKAAAGSDFAKLARESSDDAGTKARGGDLGSFTRDSHSRAFDEAAFALKPGAISAVVQTDFGFHVIKVAAHDPARTRTLAEASAEIRGRLFAALEAKTLNEWLKEARRKASISVNEPFRFGALKSEFSKG